LEKKKLYKNPIKGGHHGNEGESETGEKGSCEENSEEEVVNILAPALRCKTRAGANPPYSSLTTSSLKRPSLPALRYLFTLFSAIR
jgi:hypothetical protein